MPRRRAEQTPRKTIDGDWAPAFLAAYARCGNVVWTCQQTGIGRSTVYERRAGDPAFAAAMRDAHEASVEDLERVALERARTGSDTMLIFMLKAARPEVYRERYEVKTSGDVTMRVVEELTDGGPDAAEGDAPAPGAEGVPG